MNLDKECWQYRAFRYLPKKNKKMSDTPITDSASVDSHQNPLSMEDLALEKNVNHGGYQAYVKAEVCRRMEIDKQLYKAFCCEVYKVASGEKQVATDDTEGMAWIARLLKPYVTGD